MKQGGEQIKLENKLKFKIFKILKSFLDISRIFFLYIFDVKFDFYNFYKLRVVYSDDNNDNNNFNKR